LPDLLLPPMLLLLALLVVLPLAPSTLWPLMRSDKVTMLSAQARNRSGRCAAAPHNVLASTNAGCANCCLKEVATKGALKT
jgi:hypothetical protein